MLHPIEVKSPGSGYTGVFANTRFSKGDVLLPIFGEVQSRPSRYSLQVAVDSHIAPTTDADRPADEDPGVWYLMNHHCTSNTRMDVEALEVVAEKAIEPGEELTFDYNTTEWDMATPFECRCESSSCYGEVRGFKHLTTAQQRALLPRAAPHIQSLHEESDE